MWISLFSTFLVLGQSSYVYFKNAAFEIIYFLFPCTLQKLSSCTLVHLVSFESCLFDMSYDIPDLGLVMFIGKQCLQRETMAESG